MATQHDRQQAQFQELLNKTLGRYLATLSKHKEMTELTAINDKLKTDVDALPTHVPATEDIVSRALDGIVDMIVSNILILCSRFITLC
jgi:hypothetical protein